LDARPFSFVRDAAERVVGSVVARFHPGVDIVAALVPFVDMRRFAERLELPGDPETRVAIGMIGEAGDAFKPARKRISEAAAHDREFVVSRLLRGFGASDLPRKFVDPPNRALGCKTSI